MLPSPEQATAFATMIHVGMPSEEAIHYFIPESDEWTETSIAALHNKWVRSSLVSKALRALRGTPYEDLSSEERIKFALDKHYGEMAYFLYSHNYSLLEGADKTKADTARTALEAKLAGLAGQLDPLTQFWNDVKTGKVILKGVDTHPGYVPTLPSPLREES